MKQATGIDFNGMENSNFSLESPSTGLFYKHIRINPTSLILEVWNGSTWVAPGAGGSSTINTSKVQAVPTIMYYLIPAETDNDWIITANEAGNPRWFNNVTTCFSTVYALANANQSTRYKILIYPGQFIPTASLQIRNNMVVELMHGAEIKSSSYSISMVNGAIKGDGVLDIRISSSTVGGNLAIIHGSYFKRLECNNWTMVKANIINELICNTDTCEVEAEAVRISTVSVRGKLKLQCQSIVTLTGVNSTVDAYITTDTITTAICRGSMNINSKYIYSLDTRNGKSVVVDSGQIDVLYYNDFTLGEIEKTVFAKRITDIYIYSSGFSGGVKNRIVAGEIVTVYIEECDVLINANVLHKVVCFAVNRPFNVRVNCNEIGDVETIYGWNISNYFNYYQAPRYITSDNSRYISSHCMCTYVSGGVWRCPYGTPCIMRPYNNGEVDLSWKEGDYYSGQESRLTIIANKRLDTSKWFIAVGTVVAYIQNFNTQRSGDAHTYVMGLSQGSTVGNPNNATQLRISDLVESTAKGSGYQLNGHCVLVLDNVHSTAEGCNVFCERTQVIGTPHCAIKSSTLVVSNVDGACYNIHSWSNSRIRLHAPNTYGNRGEIGSSIVDNTEVIRVNAQDMWM